MRRGDIVTVAASGDYAKPRPAVIIQSDSLTDAGATTVILCPITSYLEKTPAFRITVEPDADNGLRAPSQIMIDKILTVQTRKIGKAVGRLDDETLIKLNRTLAFVVGLTE